MIHLHPELAFEFLDDGGVLLCQLERGDYWQLSDPSGRIWSWIWASRDFDAVAAAMARELSMSRVMADGSLTQLLSELREREAVLAFEPTQPSA